MDCVAGVPLGQSMLRVQVTGTHGFHTPSEEENKLAHLGPLLTEAHLASALPGWPSLLQQ